MNYKLTLALSFLPLLAFSQTALSHYAPGVTAEGAVYCLPKTAVEVRLLVEKTTYTPGAYSQYAQRFLRLSDVGQKASVAWRVVAVSQRAVAVADTTKAYALKFNAYTSASNIALADDGRLLAINATPREEAPAPHFTPHPTATLPDARRFLTEEILSAGSTAKTAELIAAEIYDLRENMNLLIKGQADFMPKDGQQLALMLARLEEQDRALTSLFAGVTTRDTVEHVITVAADSAFSRRILFRLSARLGVVDADDLSGSPYYISIDDLHATPTPAAAPVQKKRVENGVYINVPGRMRSTIRHEGETIQTADFPAPQFGVTELLSGSLFNKRYTTHLWLNPLSGAVERIEAEQPK